MYADNKEELRIAADALEISIRQAKGRFSREGIRWDREHTPIDDYMMVTREGMIILPLMLAAQITILNQIKSIEVEESNQIGE